MAYIPNPVDTSDVTLSPELIQLTEQLAENTHEQWARKRLAEGWTYGLHRDDQLKTTPCMVPYHELPENEKTYDRDTAMETIKVLVKMGYQISRPEPEKGGC